MRVGDAAATRAILARYGFPIRKKYGQNFLTDSGVLRRITEAAGVTKEDSVLEVGPGLGSLTQYLCEAAHDVTCVEIDAKLIPILSETLADYDNVTVVHEDILKYDLAAHHATLPEGASCRKVVANLPYYITTPVIMMLLTSPVPFDTMLFMVQKEVADRILAAPGTENYGALTIAAGYYASLSNAGTVPPSCFYPRPGVDSALLLMRRYEERPVRSRDEQLMFRLVRASFNQRRKTLVNAVSHFEGLSFSREDVCRALVSCGLPEDVRGERLSAADFAHLTDALLSFA